VHEVVVLLILLSSKINENKSGKEETMETRGKEGDVA